MFFNKFKNCKLIIFIGKGIRQKVLLWLGIGIVGFFFFSIFWTSLSFRIQYAIKNKFTLSDLKFDSMTNTWIIYIFWYVKINLTYSEYICETAPVSWIFQYTVLLLRYVVLPPAILLPYCLVSMSSSVSIRATLHLHGAPICIVICVKLYVNIYVAIDNNIAWYVSYRAARWGLQVHGLWRWM